MADRDGWKAGGFFYWALGDIFFRFFSLLFLTWFWIGFFSDLGGVLEAKMGAKTSFWSVFGDVFLNGILKSIFWCFLKIFFKVRTLIFVRTGDVL